MSSGKTRASGTVIVKELWTEFVILEGGVFGWFGWEIVGIILVVGGCVDSNGFLLVVMRGHSDLLFSVWFKI